MIFDLHVHTNHSDGIYSPEAVVDLAVRAKLDGIAITDHDTISAIEISINHSKFYNNFIVIPGIEFGCIHNAEEVHILGYFIDYTDPNIIKITNELRQSRLIRGEKMIDKINALGFNITLDEVKRLSGDAYIGRPHIARVMIDKGYVNSVSEAFDKFLNRGRPGYVERYKITIEETIKLIKNTGGIAVLAHPGLLKDLSIIDYCISVGIDGLECTHSKHTNNDRENFIKIAKSNNLIITGGSDFHGDTKDVGQLLGKFWIRIDDIQSLRRGYR